MNTHSMGIKNGNVILPTYKLHIWDRRRCIILCIFFLFAHSVHAQFIHQMTVAEKQIFAEFEWTADQTAGHTEISVNEHC